MTTTTTTNHQPLAASTTRDAEVRFSLVLPEFYRTQNRTLHSVWEILPNVELDHRVQVQEGPVQVQQRFERGTEHLYITRPGGARGLCKYGAQFLILIWCVLIISGTCDLFQMRCNFLYM